MIVLREVLYLRYVWETFPTKKKEKGKLLFYRQSDIYNLCMN